MTPTLSVTASRATSPKGRGLKQMQEGHASPPKPSRGAEIARDGGASIKRKSCVFAKRVTKTRRNEANGMSAHFDYVFGRARIPDTVTIEQYILRGGRTPRQRSKKAPQKEGLSVGRFMPAPRDAEIVRGEAHRSLRSMAYFNVRRDRKRGATMQERLPDLGSLSVGRFMLTRSRNSGGRSHNTPPAQSAQASWDRRDTHRYPPMCR